MWKSKVVGSNDGHDYAQKQIREKCLLLQAALERSQLPPSWDLEMTRELLTLNVDSIDARNQRYWMSFEAFVFVAQSGTDQATRPSFTRRLVPCLSSLTSCCSSSQEVPRDSDAAQSSKGTNDFAKPINEPHSSGRSKCDKLGIWVSSAETHSSSSCKYHVTLTTGDSGAVATSRCQEFLVVPLPSTLPRVTVLGSIYKNEYENEDFTINISEDAKEVRSLSS
ncbi:hypothetical protein H920_07283 [Fukomys damarensis]|uniref:Uncharacterized protein n=1 Tax=Fukomys damarensis TaxID=885580 RepID=A0A091DLL1_FUKDA|nr:hypothetical protein H920_07283 [Fukomys damarensis]